MQVLLKRPSPINRLAKAGCPLAARVPRGHLHPGMRAGIWVQKGAIGAALWGMRRIEEGWAGRHGGWRCAGSQVGAGSAMQLMSIRTASRCEICDRI